MDSQGHSHGAHLLEKAGWRVVAPSFGKMQTVVLAGLAGFATLAALPAWAHPGQGKLIRGQNSVELVGGTSWLVWEVHESIVIGTLLFGAWYAWAITAWRKKAALSEQPAEPWRVRLFYASLALMYLSLDGPLHHLADELLFSAHMLQHMLLQLVWAPLMILSVPPWLWQALYDLPGCKRFAAAVTRPVTATLLFNGATWAWHWPDAYNLALEVHGWHIVEHLLFMSTAVIYWFVAIAPLPALRLSYPRRMLFIFINMFGMKVLGLIISMWSTVLYTFYEKQPRAWGLDPMSDQQIGGLLMWMPGGGLMWAGIARVFWQWVNRGTPQRGLTGIAALDARRTAVAPIRAEQKGDVLLDDDQPAVSERVTAAVSQQAGGAA